MTLESISTLRNTTLLFAEDDEAIRRKTKESLMVLFKDVIEAVDGQDALEKFVDKKPDMILTDIKMPNMDGMEFIQRVRKQDPNIPIVLFSAHSSQEYLLRAIKFQIQGYIIKPSNLDDMLETFVTCAKKLNNIKPQNLKFDNNTVYNSVTNQLLKDGKELSLSGKERAVMNTLVKYSPKVVTKAELSEEVWPMESVANTTIKSTIDRLRAKIGRRHVASVPGIGWRLVL